MEPLVEVGEAELVVRDSATRALADSLRLYQGVAMERTEPAVVISRGIDALHFNGSPSLVVSLEELMEQ